MELERELLIRLSRITFNQNEENDIKDILTNNRINWFQFFKYALYHKTAILCWKNIKRIEPHSFIPKYLDDMLNYCYISTKKRNEMNQKEMQVIQDSLIASDIICIPVKGIYLLENVYHDYGLRYSGDMDFLVKKSDIKKLDSALTHLGYVMGHYSNSRHCIDPISREEKLKWRMYMSNVCPYVRISGIDLFPIYKLDFRHSLDDNLNPEPINLIIDSYINNKKVDNIYYFLHLCTHFFDEAKHIVDIELFKDLNIIKLCDIREFYLQNQSRLSVKEFANFTNRFNFGEQVFFTMSFLKAIYNDGYEDKILELINLNYSPLCGESGLKPHSYCN